MELKDYDVKNFYDEMFINPSAIRDHYQSFAQYLKSSGKKKLLNLQYATDRAQLSMGMTFNVYGENEGTERILHLDIIPRIISSSEWDIIERGLVQRIEALNLFIKDIYGQQKILKDKIIPKNIIESCPGYLKQCIGLSVPKDIWCHISGSDIVRNNNGEFYVLEDNLRCPSGVSYMLENREILKRTFPLLFDQLKVRPVADYAIHLRNMLQYLSPKDNPTIVVLTPGVYNSAYFEHSYLAQQMGVELVEGSDLVVRNNAVYTRTTRGYEQVDVIYRRIDDTFMDPKAFNPDSMLGVPGVYEVYKNGGVAIANAPGTGVADDKVVYAYVPKMIRYYLDEEAILNNVETYICEEPDDLKYVLENIDKLVIKEANAAGGYGMLMGHVASDKERKEFATKLKDNPRNYIAQPVLSLSCVPTFVDKYIEGRHVDLRPFILYGESIRIIPGGLTRVALRKDSLVVNSSQGGGSKDTWVLND